VIKVKSWILACSSFNGGSKFNFLGKLSYNFFTGTFFGLACLETQEEENALFEFFFLFSSNK